jgi:hypothetical protein
MFGDCRQGFDGAMQQQHCMLQLLRQKQLWGQQSMSRDAEAEDLIADGFSMCPHHHAARAVCTFFI